MEPLKRGTILVGHGGKTIVMIINQETCPEDKPRGKGLGYLSVTIRSSILHGGFKLGSLNHIFVFFDQHGWKVIEGKR